ncbi:S41 family peptidase [Roseateles sp. BYS78W]|uniref:S41 family peptidase n=1 Tax=Pelomonas candidula TaxID=3299025 RepID=A0ABW7HC45_9BURK
MKNLLIAFGLALSVTFAAAGAAPPPELSAEAAQRDLRLLQRALVALHPGLYRYTTPAQLDAAFDTARAEVAGGASRAQLYLLATRLAATVRCGHTWTNPANQTPAVQALTGRQTLPLVLRFVEGRLLVRASAAPTVPAGSELLAIEGQSPARIAQALLPYLRADGSTDGKRLAQLDDDENGGAMQRLFPLLFPPSEAGWRLRLAGGREVVVPVLSAEARERALAAGWLPPDAAWQLHVDGEVAVLTLPTFSFWRDGFDGRAFLDRAFAELAARGIRRLIIDLRRNEGGDDALGRALLAHLITEPYETPGGRRESAYERVPYALARYLDTWDFSFFDRTGRVTRGPNGRWQLPDSPSQRVEPAAPHFAGRVVALVGPQNSSAGYLTARDLQAARAATLIGQPTGGNQRGLNGGQLAWITLPASGVAVDIPLLAHLPPGNPPDAGVQPDVLVVPRWADAVAGVDTEMVAARRLLGY